ncbi:MAG TPA: 5'-nucleotidase C-terminal domain-containing protein [Myxococcota bacterium]|jgi:2',3'-cyclic-nucleotide 2'-phosphodiesterase (5'-nucleotidase family)|nr:5'-nucleotidase C-terminal domain-containing protein [Myxococcota bacterium]
MRARLAAFTLAAVCAAAVARAATPAPAPAPVPAPAPASAPSSAPAPAAAAPTLSLFYLVDIGGRFDAFSCRAADAGAPRALDFANTVAALERAAGEARARGEPDPLTIVGGDVLSPGAYARAVLARSGGAAELAGLLERASVDFLALGNHEFDVENALLGDFLAAAEARGLRAHLANADCDAAASPLCRWLGDDGGRVPRRYRLFTRGGVRVAVVAVLDEDLARRVAPGHAAGLSLRDPARAAREVIHGLRARGEADVVVLVAHVEHSSTAPRDVLELVRSLAGFEQPDVVISNGLHADYRAAGTVEVMRLSEGLPPIVGTEPFGVRPGALRLRVDRPAVPGVRAALTVLSIGDVPVDPGAAAPDLRARFDADTAAHCAVEGVPLGPGRLAAPMDAGTFSAFVLEALRRESRTEVALLNAGAVDASSAFPLAGHVSLDDLRRAIPFDARVVVARVKGDELERFLKQRWRLRDAGDKRALRLVGATTADGVTFKINGRALEPDVPYKLATIDFVASGGDDILEGFSGPKWPWKPFKLDGAPVLLRDLVVRFLRDDVHPRRGAAFAALGVRESFAPLDERFLYDARVDANAGLTDVTIRSSLSAARAAAAPALTRDQFTSLFADVALALYANSSDHAFDFNLHYAFALSTPDVFDVVPVVNTDVLTFEGIYRLRYFKKALSRTLRRDRWWVPEPYAGTFVETELIPPRDAAGRPVFPPGRTATATAGYRFLVGPKLEFKIGAGLKSSGAGFSIDPPVFVGELGFRLKKDKLGAPGGVPIYLTADATLYSGQRFENLATLVETELRAKAVLELALGFNLYFTLTQTVYGLGIYDPRAEPLRDRDPRLLRAPTGHWTVGWATDTLAAIRVDLDFRFLNYD